MTIFIVQPVVPHYRVSFFCRLVESFPDVLFYASDVDDIGVKSVDSSIFKYRKLGAIKKFCGAVWQGGVVSIAAKVKKNDVVVVNGNPRYLSTMVLIFLSKFKGGKVVWWGQGWSSGSTSLTFYIRRFLMNLCDRVLLYTQNEVSLFRKKYRWKLCYLNNGIENDEIIRNRSSYFSEHRDPAVLFVGRVTPKSNLSLLITSLLRMEESVELHVVGDGPLLDECKKLAARSGLAGRVHFYGSIIQEKDISLIANKCRVFVYPGNVGLSLIHAMNYGLPAIVHSDVKRHMPEIACHEPGVTGLFFDPEIPGDLSEKINSILFDGDKLNFYSKNCISVTENDFNAKKMCSHFVEMVRKL